MSPHQYYNAIALFHQANYVAIKSAWERHHDWRAAWEEIQKDARIRPEEAWRDLERRTVRLLLATDEQFPLLLREMHNPPFGLYVTGAFAFNPPTIAIVGTRRATREGILVAEKLSKQLAENNITVVSGLALGIDGAAHRGALAAFPEPGRKGTTIAVLPTGLDRIYPPHHENLAQEIAASSGALISEYPFNTPSLPYHFLERNRIVSGLSLGTLVIEAPLGSGALVTARLALDYNREVLVIPGPITHPNYAGSHRLIQNGAALVTCFEDICHCLNIPLVISSAINNRKNTKNLSADERQVIACLTNAGKPLPIDTIVALTTLELQVINQTVALLTINGIIKETSGGYTL